MTAKTNQQKQREFRARKLNLGLSEVRGIFAKKESHNLIKKNAAELIAALNNGGAK